MDDGAVRQPVENRNVDDEIGPRRIGARRRAGRLVIDGPVVAVADDDRRVGEEADRLDHRAGQDEVIDERHLPHAVIEHFHGRHIDRRTEQGIGAGAPVSRNLAKGPDRERFKDAHRRFGTGGIFGGGRDFILRRPVLPAIARDIRDKDMAGDRKGKRRIGQPLERGRDLRGAGQIAANVAKDGPVTAEFLVHLPRQTGIGRQVVVAARRGQDAFDPQDSAGIGRGEKREGRPVRVALVEKRADREIFRQNVIDEQTQIGIAEDAETNLERPRRSGRKGDRGEARGCCDSSHDAAQRPVWTPRDTGTRLPPESALPRQGRRARWHGTARHPPRLVAVEVLPARRGIIKRLFRFRVEKPLQAVPEQTIHRQPDPGKIGAGRVAVEEFHQFPAEMRILPGGEFDSVADRQVPRIAKKLDARTGNVTLKPAAPRAFPRRDQIANDAETAALENGPAPE